MSGLYWMIICCISCSLFRNWALPLFQLIIVMFVELDMFLLFYFFGVFLLLFIFFYIFLLLFFCAFWFLVFGFIF